MDDYYVAPADPETERYWNNKEFKKYRLRVQKARSILSTDVYIRARTPAAAADQCWQQVPGVVCIEWIRLASAQELGAVRTVR